MRTYHRLAQPVVDVTMALILAGIASIAAVFFGVLFGLLLVATAARSQGWVDQLQSATGAVCCMNYDGRRLDDPDWDTLGKVNDELSGYRVHEDLAWHEVPLTAVVTARNQDGIARVWWNLTADDTGRITAKAVRCFLPGATG